MGDNYLVLNGKRIDLTEEQIKTLGIELKKSPFERGGEYFYITPQGNVTNDFESNGCLTSEYRYKVGNYCTDEEIMKQRALYETLNRLLWRFSMQNDGDKINWNDNNHNKYRINFDYTIKEFFIYSNNFKKENSIYFNTEQTAERAIKEIIMPFLKEHPDFIW